MDNQSKHTDGKEMKWLDRAADLMDSRYRIPGTNIRFGLDFLVGLIPYAGDTLTFTVSGVLVIMMASKGISTKALLLMVGNILLDLIVGSIPLLGDIFDLSFKANKRNVKIARDYYQSGKHTGPAWPILVGIGLFLLALLVVSVYLMYQLIVYLVHLF